MFGLLTKKNSSTRYAKNRGKTKGKRGSTSAYKGSGISHSKRYSASPKAKY